MREFGTLKVCPKCEGTKLTPTYERAEYYEAFGSKPIETAEECMKIECDRCRYKEYEYPADHIEQPEEKDDK